ncbi:MAG: HRDC domain-containing protein [Desulfobulbaceae bacterium]|nr:HRDC domain-containing protein [Desulfobulbaceae bacterium]
MPLQYKFFSIAARGNPEDEGELNRFLRHNRILTIHRGFVQDGENSYWSLAVEYLGGADRAAGQQTPGRSGKERVDYKEVLSPEDFALFARLREWRKDKADEAGVPVYTIFTNEQLAQIAARRILSKTGLREIEGVGESRIKKYGDAVLQIMQDMIAGGQTQDETGRESV